MVNIMSLSISLDKPPGTAYMRGETIQGVVNVDVTGTKTCTCDLLSLTVQGTGHVEIVETRYTYAGNTAQTQRIYDVYNANESYFSGTIKLLGKATLPRGRTLIPFQYSLPTEGLPMSYTAPNGSVAYEVQAIMERPKPEYDLHAEVDFIVGPLLDLNRISLADYGPERFTDQQSVERQSCCASKPFSVGQVGVQIIVPKRHFIPGEFVQFTVITDNKCDLRVLSGTMELILNVTCIAEGIVKGYTQTLGQKAGPEVAPNCVQTWEVTDFIIPALKPDVMPTSGLGGCNLITVDYGLRYSAHLEQKDEGCCSCDSASESLHAFIPLIIGTIQVNG